MQEAIIPAHSFCNSLYTYSRRKTREVTIGEIPMGANHPIRVQSMTTTDTMDTLKTVEQSIRMIEAGCEYVRITAPSLNEAQNLQNIKDELKRRGYTTPLIADIHFTPNAAELAARIVEKVRVNPGNYVDKKKFEVKDYTNESYEAELERIRKRFSPLVKICKEYGTAMRIGTNHGSLSDRIMNRYGDTPEGMVESAMEFLRICEDLNYYNIVLSMKASNPLVMMAAYRLLVVRMDAENMYYPLHLGVTEAGEDEEGRVKSAMGIGALLEDGLGDTIRVSLTEAPEFEIPVARALVDRYKHRELHNNISQLPNRSDEEVVPLLYNPYQYKRRESNEVGICGNHNVPRVIASIASLEHLNELSLKAIDYQYDAITDKWNMGDQGADYIYLGTREANFMLPNGAKGIYDYSYWINLSADKKVNTIPLLSFPEFLSISTDFNQTLLVQANAEELDVNSLKKMASTAGVILVLSTNNEHAMASMRKVFIEMQALDSKVPVILKRNYAEMDDEHFILQASTDTGGLLADGFGDGLWLEHFIDNKPFISPSALKLINRTSFNILQACRTRISRTEYISCPSCGRTLFDLEETTAMIRKKTDHLKGVKIAIMGCIVNGPGEMADADFGYVGAGPGKITLYKGKNIIKRNIDTVNALDELIELIKTEGQWVDRQ
jgi:(E)-4-hydroxy-3-methylbut-2-enyl-diphosphate synthase